MKLLTICIHASFCARKCACCDFASIAGREGKPWAMQGAAEKAVEF